MSELTRPAEGDSQMRSGPDRLLIELSGDPAEVPAARTAIRELATRNGFDARARDLALALDELVANAQEHGAPPVRVEAWVDTRLVVLVTDHGDGFLYHDILTRHPPPKLGHRGRGLWIVRQVVDHVTVESRPGSMSVRIELTHEPQIGA